MVFAGTERLKASPAWALALAVAVAAGCSEDGSGVAGPDATTVPALTVDASTDWVYVDLADTAEVVAVADASASAAWDIAFFATSVKLNGGSAGPGDVAGHCLCTNASMSDAGLVDLTPESELDVFLGASAEDVPADAAAWRSDALVPAIDGWYAYNPSTHAVSAAPESVWRVRTAEGDAYAKLHVIALEGMSPADAGQITIEFAYQAPAATAFGEPDTAVVDVSDGAAVYFDLAAGAVSDSDSDPSGWDVLFEGYTIRLNGGVSGDGEAAAVPAEAAFSEIDNGSDLPASVYDSSTDVYGGVFEEHPWYRYDLQGEHQIWPTYDVYLIKRGGETYKVQLVGYYNETGADRHITLRYAPLGE